MTARAAAVVADVAGTTDPTHPGDGGARFPRTPPSPCGAAQVTNYDRDMPAGRRRILLVEDEAAIAEPLTESLTHEGFDLEVAGTVAAALEAVQRRLPDLILLDLMLPDGSGYEVCREIRRSSTVPIIMLTARGEETDRIIGLELGADDYVVKPFSAREVAARARAVLRRVTAAATPGGDDPLQAGDVSLDPATRTVTRAGQAIDLTRKEFDLLRLLMARAGTVVTREQLIDEVWDVNWFGSTKTLDVHVSALRRKLGEDAPAPRYLHTVRGVGFRFDPPASDAAARE